MLTSVLLCAILQHVVEISDWLGWVVEFVHWSCRSVVVCVNEMSVVQGKWTARKIPNPNYYEDLEPYKMTPIVSRLCHSFVCPSGLYWSKREKVEWWHFRCGGQIRNRSRISNFLRIICAKNYLNLTELFKKIKVVSLLFEKQCIGLVPWFSALSENIWNFFWLWVQTVILCLASVVMMFLQFLIFSMLNMSFLIIISNNNRTHWIQAPLTYLQSSHNHPTFISA